MSGVTPGPRLGLTMMSFAREIYLSVWDLGECLRQAGCLGPGTALELTGAQSLPGYPALLPEVERTVRRGVDAYGLVPACYDAYAERGRRYGRPADLAATAELVEAEMAIAHRLGFPMLRLNDATPDLLAAVLPAAERLGVQVVVELHGKPARHPDSVRLAAYFDAAQSPCLGFLQDLGAMMRAVPPSFLQWGRRGGRPAAVIDAVEQGWNVAAPVAHTLQEVSRLGGSEADRDWAFSAYAMFGRNPVADLELVLPYLAHVHGKFFGIDPSGTEPAIDYPAAVATLRRGGYEGIVSSEYISWAPPSELDSLDQVAAHHRMLRSLWQAGSSHLYRRRLYRISEMSSSPPGQVRRYW